MPTKYKADLIKLLLAGLILINPAFAFSQKGKVKLVSQIELKGVLFDKFEETVVKRCGNTIYIHQKYLQDTVITFLPYDLTSGKVKEPIILNYNLTSNKDYFSDFYIRNDTVILLSYSGKTFFSDIRIFTKGTDNTYKVSATECVLDELDHCFLSGNDIILWNCYDHPPTFAKINCGFKVYGLSDLKLKHSQKLVFDGIAFTHNVKRFMDINEGNIILTNTLRNKITIYNLKGNKTDSIGDNSLLNAGIDKCPVNFENRDKKFNLKDSIYKVIKFNKTVKRIEKVFYINGSTVLTTLKPKGKSDNRKVTIYKRNEKGNWKVACKKLNTKQAGRFNWSESLERIITDNMMYVVYPKLPKVLALATEEYFKKNPFLQLYIYEYSY